MSVESMTMVMIAGPENMGNTAIENLVVNKEFHAENSIKTLAEVDKLFPLDSSNPYSEQLAKACEVARNLEIELDYRDYAQSNLELKGVSEYIQKLSSHITQLFAEKETHKKKIENNTIVCKQLSHYESFEVELSSLFSMRYQKVRFGRIPTETYNECMAKVNSRPDAYYINSLRTGRWVYGAYFALPQQYQEVDELFSTMGFERIHIDVDGNIESTVEEVFLRLTAETQNAEKRITEIDAELKTLKETELERLLEAYSYLRFYSDSINTNTCAGRREGRFYIVGWIPTDKEEEYVNDCESHEGFGCFLTPAEEMKEIDPPIKMKKSFLSSIYEPFVEMYGLPKKGEVDPRLFMLLTYTLLFGIMFGDMGQGFTLIIIGLLLWRFKNLWLGRIVAICGASAMVFGYVYGSVFGSENIIKGLNFKVLEGSNTMTALMIAVVLGIALILICMILNIITGIRQKDIKKIFFSPNGLAGFVLYAGLAGGVMLQMLKGIKLFTVPYILLVIILPVVLIYAATPLSKLLKGEEDWKPESIGMFFVEGFFELFETMLAYLSNTLSFLRVGAFAVVHSGMMMVVYLLSSGAGGSHSIGGLIFGNIFVTVLETVLVCIQVMRLSYYEMFGRFYEGGGVKFSPKTINYKAAE